jgi:hypothetical protein
VISRPHLIGSLPLGSCYDPLQHPCAWDLANPWFVPKKKA